MGLWDFYFVVKLALYFAKYIGFHFFANLAFAIFLLVPLKHPRALLLRRLIAPPLGVVLFYYDTWLPPFSRLIANASQLEDFDLVYLGELVGRFVSYPVLAGLLLLFGIYHYVQRKLRMSTFVLLAMLFTLVPMSAKSPTQSVAAATGGLGPAVRPAEPPVFSAGKPAAPPTDVELSARLSGFYQQEATRNVSFSPPGRADAPFDILFLQICSLAWDDLEYEEQLAHPLWQQFQIVFNNFNSAASYSGPSVVRLLRGSAGQQKHTTLYDPPTSQSLTFENLQQLGFEPQLVMNHDGKYGDFRGDIRDRGGLKATPFDLKRAAPYLQSFDGTPIYDDYDVLAKWWNHRLALPQERVALFYNSISLHDGNQYVGKPRTNSLKIYRPRLNKLLTDLERFFTLLQSSGRKIVVVFIPEHGASMRGDKMQIPGMREIPSPRISHVPVAIKLFTGSAAPQSKPLTVAQPTSYLAVSQLVADFIRKSPFGEPNPGLETYVSDLPSTAFVAENSDLVVMRYGDRYYMHAKDTAWVEYDPSP
jgi:cellulose synthase operon protein YhjU